MHAPIRYSLFLIATPFLLAQSAQISGIIMDASKSVAPGAIVNVKSEQTGLSRMVQASEEGSYVIPFLPPGRYAMEAGFQTFRQTGIAIDASQTARIDFTLQPGALEQSVTISADYVGRHQLHRQAVTAARTAAAISIDPCVSPSLWIPPSLTAYATAAYHPANTLISSSL